MVEWLKVCRGTGEKGQNPVWQGRGTQPEAGTVQPEVKEKRQPKQGQLHGGESTQRKKLENIFVIIASIFLRKQEAKLSAESDSEEGSRKEKL